MPQPPTPDKPARPTYLRTQEVADLLHVSPKTVSRWAYDGKLPCLRTLGGHRRYPEAEIRELIERLTAELEQDGAEQRTWGPCPHGSYDHNACLACADTEAGE
jgi:excisionase family DNA binding protein